MLPVKNCHSIQNKRSHDLFDVFAVAKYCLEIIVHDKVTYVLVQF